MIKRLTLALGVVAFVTASMAGMANAQVDKCKAGKQKAAGKSAGGELKCDSKADTKGQTAADIATCSAKPGAALVSGYSKTDAKSGPCAGTAAASQTAIDNCQTASNTGVGNSGDPRTVSKCDGKKVAAMGKKLGGLLGCDSKESSKGADQSACRTGAASKFTAAMGKLATATDCSVAPGAGDTANLESIIDTCRTNINNTVTAPASPCAPIVVGELIPNTYQLQGTTGEKRCVTTSPANRFAICVTDSDCDNDPPCTAGPPEGDCTGTCLQLPWVTADGQVMPFPTGVLTTFTVSAAGAFPACEHNLCIPCGNPNAACAGVPGCEVAGNPNGCIPRGTQGCCNQPGFTVPTFFVNILGGLCSRVDQIDCGVGVINTSNPQTGDNDVTKIGDTSDPGADCMYGTGDDPAPLTCSIVGEGNDYKGKIVRTIGNGSADANGIHYRLTTPELSTTWQDNQSPPGTCANGSTFDNLEGLISQLVLKAEPATAGVSGSFVDMSGEGCKRAGSGFIAPANPATDGPITASTSPGPLKPQPYNGSAGSVSGAVSEVFSGPNSPIRDIGFVAITPNKAAVKVSPLACSCTVVPGCPE